MFVREMPPWAALLPLDEEEVRMPGLTSRQGQYTPRVPFRDYLEVGRVVVSVLYIIRSGHYISNAELNH